MFYTDGLTEFKRDTLAAERTLLAAMTRLVNESNITQPAAFIQQSVMGSERPTDETVLLIVQVGVAPQNTWTFDSRSSHEAHSLRRELAGFMRSFAPNEEDLFTAELIIGEVLANTVEHAPGSVRVEIDWTGTNPVVTVADAGPGLSRFAPQLPADALNENGARSIPDCLTGARREHRNKTRNGNEDADRSANPTDESRRFGEKEYAWKKANPSAAVRCRNDTRMRRTASVR